VTKSVLIDARVDMLAVAVTLVLPKTEVAMKPLALSGGRTGPAPPSRSKIGSQRAAPRDAGATARERR